MSWLKRVKVFIAKSHHGKVHPGDAVTHQCMLE